MDPQQRRRIVAIAVVVLGVLAVGGVIAASVADRSGSDNLGSDPVAAVRGAPAKVQGRRLRADVELGTTGALQVQVRQVGLFDAKAGQADVRIDGLPAGSTRVIVDGSVLYAQSGKPVDGKPWGRADLPQDGAAGGGPTSVSPRQLDDLFEVLATTRTAQDKGRERIDGMELRHYTATIDTGALAGSSAMFARGGATAPAVDVWLDDDGAPRRLALASDVSGLRVTVLARIRAIGVTDPITVPPPDEVAPVGDVGTLLGAGAG